MTNNWLRAILRISWRAAAIRTLLIGWRGILKESSLIIVICALLTSCTHKPRPDDTIRNAYAWYVHELKSGVNPLEQKRTELKEFVTEGFLSSIDNMRPELEASPFMDAQTFDAKLSIKKITNDSRAAAVRIGLSGRISGQHTLNVYLVKVEGRWKIDDIKVVDESSARAAPTERLKRKAAVAAVRDGFCSFGIRRS